MTNKQKLSTKIDEYECAYFQKYDAIYFEKVKKLDSDKGYNTTW